MNNEISTKDNYSILKNFYEFAFVLKKEDALLIYFSHEKCNVCKILKPKIAELIKKKFPRIKLYYADTVTAPEISGQNNVFTVPTLICYFEGREAFRKSRNISIEELANDLYRPYSMVFGE